MHWRLKYLQNKTRQSWRSRSHSYQSLRLLPPRVDVTHHHRVVWVGEQRVAVYYNRRGLIVSSTSSCTRTCALCQHLWCNVFHHCRWGALCGVWFYVHGSNSTHNCLHIELASLACESGNHSLHNILSSAPFGKLGLSKQAKVTTIIHRWAICWLPMCTKQPLCSSTYCNQQLLYIFPVTAHYMCHSVSKWYFIKHPPLCKETCSPSWYNFQYKFENFLYYNFLSPLSLFNLLTFALTHCPTYRLTMQPSATNIYNNINNKNLKCGSA